jgi:F-type H+-transporting ATPase subunit b
MKIPGRRVKQRTWGSMCAVLMITAAIMLAGMVPAWGSSEGGEHGGEHGAVSKPWQVTDTAKVLNFAVLAIGLFLILRKPVAQALNDRIKGIKDELEDLEKRKIQVENQLAEYNQKLATLDKEAEQVVAEYVRQGEEARARILKEAELAADKLKEQAQKNIQHEFAQAKQQLQAEIVAKALSKAEQLIKSSISADDQDRLVDEYLEKVVA